MKGYQLNIGDIFAIETVDNNQLNCEVEGFFNAASKAHLIIYSTGPSGARTYYAKRSDIDVVIKED